MIRAYGAEPRLDSSTASVDSHRQLSTTRQPRQCCQVDSLDSLDSGLDSLDSVTVIRCVKTVKLSSSTARQSRHSLDSSCQARQPRHTQPYMYIPKCSRNLVSCRAWTKSQEGMSSIVGIWCNPGELRASEDVRERAVWYVYVRHTFPFDFDKKVK
jgi:hypothetical protein